MSSEPPRDPYSPDWIDGPPRPEDSAYHLELRGGTRRISARRSPKPTAGSSGLQSATVHTASRDRAPRGGVRSC